MTTLGNTAILKKKRTFYILINDPCHPTWETEITGNCYQWEAFITASYQMGSKYRKYTPTLSNPSLRDTTQEKWSKVPHRSLHP